MVIIDKFGKEFAIWTGIWNQDGKFLGSEEDPLPGVWKWPHSHREDGSLYMTVFLGGRYVEIFFGPSEEYEYEPIMNRFRYWLKCKLEDWADKL